MPGGSISSFNIEVQSPIDGSKLSFVVDGSMFDGRSSTEVSTLIKKQIGRQMRDAGRVFFNTISILIIIAYLVDAATVSCLRCGTVEHF